MVAIEEAWLTLYKSLPRRMHALMDVQGGASKY